MTDAPRCPRHDEPLTLLEEGWLDGVRRTYWAGGCCSTVVKVDEQQHEEPSLFGGDDG